MAVADLPVHSKVLFVGHSNFGSHGKIEYSHPHVFRNGNLECVAALLAAKADMNAEDLQKWTPLHNASCSSSLATVDKLIEAGANPANRDVDGWTPLHFAARFNNVEAIESLLSVCTGLDMWSRVWLRVIDAHL